MTLKEFIAAKHKILTDAPDKLFTAIDKVQKQVFDEVLALIDSLERRDGLIVLSKSNLDKAAEINSKLESVFNTTDFTEAVTDFASEFDQNKKINQKYFFNAFPSLDPTGLQEAVYKATKTQAIEALAGSTIETGFLQGIKDQITDAVLSGSSWKDTLTSLREYALGSDEVDGKLLSHSKQIATDAISISDRAYTNAIAEDLDAEWYYYAGGEIATSREFCIERHDKYFHFKEVESWAKLEWDGKNPTTTAQSIFLFAGGFSCQHSILPVSVTSVPKEVLRRNITSGNYSPTEKERELLGI